MSTRFLQTAISFAIALAACTACAQHADSPAPQSPSTSLKTSRARAVRLSEVKGAVALGRTGDAVLVHAFANLPINEGSRLQTGEGRAEVEFEDDSTIRIAPNTIIEFTRLELLPSGAKASTITVLKGTAYVSLIPSYVIDSRGNDFRVLLGGNTLHLQPSDHIRMQVDGTEARLAVLDGAGKARIGLIEGPTGATRLVKKSMFTLNLAGPSEPRVVRSIPRSPFDKWDSISTEVHKRNASLGLLPKVGNKGGQKQSSVGMPHDIFR